LRASSGAAGPASEQIRHSLARARAHARSLHSAEVVALAARYRMPAIYLWRQSVLDGGFISYGSNQTDFWRRAGSYVDKILKGEKPGDLPVEQPTRFDLTVNLKTAKELGITVPPSILAQADEVVE
jgi:putative ABC transport system substrate-binding protein